MNDQLGDELMRMLFPHINTQNNQTNTPAPVSQEDIDSLQTFEQSEETNLQCSICFDNLSDTCIVLNCDHKFHRRCLNQWLSRHNTCPMCRTRVIERETSNNDHSTNINIVQRINMVRPHNNDTLCIHFIFSNGLQVDTMWYRNSKCYQILEFLTKFMIITNPVIKLMYNLGEAQFSFSSEDNMVSLNKELHQLMIPNHAIMRVFN